ncbi:MAG: ABC transporter ATP-binding protein [Sarcina sp.]
MGIIRIENLNKRYGNKVIFKDLSLEIEENKIYGLLGRNGTGKTTLINLITDRINRDSGKVIIDGEDVHENDKILEKIYCMVEQNLYPNDFKIKEVLKWTKEFYPNFNMDYALELAKKFNLDITKKIKTLSAGYSSILKIIITLSSNVDILIFDEPVIGLDASHREFFYKELMRSYLEKPKTIIISTHIIEEVSNILEKVIILKDGEVIKSEEVDELLTSAYTVSGIAEKVEKYIENKNIVNVEEFSVFKAATIVGEIKQEDKLSAKELDLAFSKVELQKLFIYLTEKGEV